MIKTEYICDRCGKVQETSDQFWYVRVSVSHVRTPVTVGYTAHTKEATWCRACVEVIKMLPTENKLIAAMPEPTLEDMIREICREEVGK
ncbi:MAG: hypothetical protein V1685_02645 [Parcubacteria group bacterium]